MARKEKGCATEVFALLCVLPWWVSVVIGVLLYIYLRYYLPGQADENQFWAVWGASLPQIAWFAVLMLIPAGISAYNSFRKRRIVDQQKGIETIRALSWKEFEELLGEAFRRQGYLVRENEQGGPDGGVDLQIEREGQVYLVQCKHWQSARVGVKIVREMLGLVTAHQAQGAIVVASGEFTQEARAFAAKQPIELMAGNQLVELVRSVQRPSSAVQRSSPTRDAADRGAGAEFRRCPFCAGQLVQRTMRRGAQAGRTFWRCANHPRCGYVDEPEG